MKTLDSVLYNRSKYVKYIIDTFHLLWYRPYVCSIISNIECLEWTKLKSSCREKGINLHLFFHDHRVFVFKSNRPSSQLYIFHSVGSNWYSRSMLFIVLIVNSARSKQNGRHFTIDMFKCILLNENLGISLKISLKFVPKGPFSNFPALFQIMA